jgi:hypothetical protein
MSLRLTIIYAGKKTGCVLTFSNIGKPGYVAMLLIKFYLDKGHTSLRAIGVLIKIYLIFCIKRKLMQLKQLDTKQKRHADDGRKVRKAVF